MSRAIRGLAHECRMEATRIRQMGLQAVTVDRDAIAGLLERCATALEEMDATVPAVSEIQNKAERALRRLSTPDALLVDGESVLLASTADVSAAMIDLCAYLQREKAIA